MSLQDNNESRRRDHLIIIAEILEVAVDGALKTQMMYRANLSFTQLNSYLRFILDRQLMEISSENGKSLYKTTHKGALYLQSCKEIQTLMKKRAR